MSTIIPIDLNFLDVPEAVGCFLIKENNQNILIETGPASTIEHLKIGLKRQGLELSAINHVLLTHIHLDHAGAAWILAESGAKIHVHPKGKKHLENPEKLYLSAKRLYGDQMNFLWGDIKPIPEGKIIECEDGKPILNFFPIFTPGHATHHVSWQWGENIFTGDVGGVKLIKNGPIIPPCPPPDIDLEAWLISIDKILSKNPKFLWLTHYGKINNPPDHLKELKETLKMLFQLVESNMIEDNLEEKFNELIQSIYSKYSLTKSDIKKYEVSNPSNLSLNGILRYYRKLADR